MTTDATSGSLINDSGAISAQDLNRLESAA